MHGGIRPEGLTALRRAWESSQRSTKEDWAEWMRNFSIELLKQSPSKALKACASLAQVGVRCVRLWVLLLVQLLGLWPELRQEAGARNTVFYGSDNCPQHQHPFHSCACDVLT